jgi:hypothetical protein
LLLLNPYSLQNRLEDTNMKQLLYFEPYILGIITFAFWFPTPGRADWLWLLGLLLPVLVARWWVHRRLLTRTPLDGWLAALLLLGAVNVLAAPYTRGWLMLARPALGIWLFYTLIEQARTRRDMEPLMRFMIAFGLFSAVLALGATQWNDKSDELRFIIDELPRINNFPGLGGGFNGNEIGGMLVWLVPLTGGLAAYRWRSGQRGPLVPATFGLLALALILGQSRMAIAGAMIGLFLIGLSLLPSGVSRWIGLLGLTGVFILQAYLFIDVSTTMPERDIISSSARPLMWSQVVAMMRDYPLTGVGLSMFRDGRVGARYPIPGYEDRPPPHTHNEFLQFGADMGLPGLVLYAGLHLTTGYMLWYAWRHGTVRARQYAVAIGAGLLAHMVFGLVDAITLWDRLAFVFWLMLGLAGAQYTLVRLAIEQATPEAEPG